MTSFTCAKTNQSVSLTEQIASSGEGEVWRTSRPKVLAKIYHTPDEERAKKLDIMVKHAPADPNAHKNHVSFAWPQSVLKDAQGKVIGFLMPEIVGGEELVNVCNPSRRKRLGLELDWRFLHVAARNVAALVQAIHKEGYVLGDIKLQNILVNSRALPSIIDIDSFQVRDAATGKVYRCPVASEGFTPVELLGKDIATVTQLEEHDRFRLGVVVYHLLFGNHPFQGQWTGTGESLELNELIRQGFWPFAPNSLLQPSNRTIPLKVVDSGVRNCFLKCFNVGHKNSSVRPTARDWVEALEAASTKIKSCHKIDSHYYSSTYKHCYWCERKSLLNVDIFDFYKNELKPESNLELSNIFSAEGIKDLVRQDGKNITVFGLVYNTQYESSLGIYSIFFSNHKNIISGYHPFKIVIFSGGLRDLEKAGISLIDLNQLVGKYLTIKGELTLYRGSENNPEILLQKASQLEILDKSKAQILVNQLSYVSISLKASKSSSNKSIIKKSVLIKNKAKSLSLSAHKTAQPQKTITNASNAKQIALITGVVSGLFLGSIIGLIVGAILYANEPSSIVFLFAFVFLGAVGGVIWGVVCLEKINIQNRYSNISLTSRILSSIEGMIVGALEGASLGASQGAGALAVVGGLLGFFGGALIGIIPGVIIGAILGVVPGALFGIVNGAINGAIKGSLSGRN